VGEAYDIIGEQRPGPGLGVVAMRVGAEDAIAGGPDDEGHHQQPHREADAGDDQLALCTGQPPE
jgi:hypothetical protein